MRFYKYDVSKPIPAPVLELELGNPVTGKRLRKPGKVDSGADLLIIPSDVVDELELKQRGIELVSGYRRNLPPEETPAYYVDVEIADFLFRRVRAIESFRPDALIGRNVLNKLRVVLDGKNLTFEVSEP